MVERGCRHGFALEALQPLGVAGELGGQDLDRHVARRVGVARAIDFAHSPGPNGSDDFISAETGTWSQWHRTATLCSRIVSLIAPLAQPELSPRLSLWRARTPPEEPTAANALDR